MENIAMFVCNLPAWLFAFVLGGCMSMEVIKKRLAYAPLVFLVPAAALLLMNKSFFLTATSVTLGAYGAVFLVGFFVCYSLACHFGIPMIDRGCTWELGLPVTFILIGLLSYFYKMLPYHTDMAMNATLLGYFLSQACVYIVRRDKTR
jgi:hypothetical protein